MSGPLAFIVLVAIGALIFYVGRRTSEVAPPLQDPLSPESVEPEPPFDDGSGEPRTKQPCAVGHELPMPFPESELEQLYESGALRAELLNYYFKNIDLLSGPADPDNFCDEFSCDFQNLDDGHKWTSTNTVATPQGLADMLDKEDYRYVYGDGMIIVRRYDIVAILRAVIELHEDSGPPAEEDLATETSPSPT